MMDIYCRAKELNSDNFVYGIPVRDDGADDYWGMMTHGDYCIPINTKTLGMSTNATDKKGMYIFEGDIVAIPSATSDITYKFVVFYNKSTQSFEYSGINENTNTFNYTGFGFTELMSSNEYCIEDMCIMGNIYDTIPRLRRLDIFEEEDAC